VEQEFLQRSSLPIHITLTPCPEGQNTFDISILENSGDTINYHHG